MYLLTAFAGFVVVAALTTIYGIQLHVQDAIVRFDESMHQTGQVDRLHVAAREQLVRLHNIIDGRREIDVSYHAAREEFFTQLRSVALFIPQRPESAVGADILESADTLDRETTACLELVANSRHAEARDLLANRLEHEFLTTLAPRLQAAKALLADESNQSVNALVSTNTQVLVLALVVFALAAGLLVIGAPLIRRWLILPITALRDATTRFSEGDLAFRIPEGSTNDDELGALGTALNTMAESLAGAQAGLHTSEMKYRSLFENLRDAVVICNIQGRIVEYHDGETNILGAQGREHVGRNLLDVWPEWRSENVDWAALVERVITTGKRFHAVDVDLKRDDNDEPATIVDLLIYPVAYDDADYAAIVLRDVTERQRLERRLRRAETMEATGTLAGGIAHDFNNLLTSAIGTLSLLAPDLKSAKHSELVHTALRGCWQAAGLARRLLDFACGGQGKPRTLRLREMVEFVLNSLDGALFENIKVRTTWNDDVLVKVDKDQLTQIVLNLVTNACDAMPDGGTLHLDIDRTSTTDPETKAPPRPYAVVTVSDTGGGMTAEVRDRIFEPFFTTKVRDNHRGRGLGLAIVYAAVKSAGGFVLVESRVGEGTTFRIHLPEGEGIPETIEPPVYAPPASKGEGTILVVDDEPMIVKTCTEAFQKWGYSVVTAAGIEEAERKFDESDSEIVLALIDVNLIDGSGVVLAQDLVELAPQLPIIFATGYGEPEIPAAIKSNVRGHLAKPFHLDELACLVSAAVAPAELRE